jgi:hypothetical protein
MHDWSDTKCLEIIAQIKLAMRRGYSRLILNDFVLPDQGCEASLAGYDLAMMSMVAAQERTRRQWESLLEDAGLKVLSISKLKDEVEGVIEAELP